MDDVQQEYFALNLASIVCAFSIMAMVVWLRWTQPLIDPLFCLQSVPGHLPCISIRLTQGIFLFRTNYSLMDTLLPSQPLIVRLLLGSIYIFPLWFAFLNVTIALDLHLSFLCRQSNMKRFQRWYLPASFFAAIVLGIPIMLVGTPYWDKELHSVMFDWNFSTSIAIELLCSDIWMAFAIVYAFFIILAVLFQILKDLKAIKVRTQTIQYEFREKEGQLVCSVLRILLYPCVLVICQPATIVVSWLFVTDTAFTKLGSAIRRIEAITNGLQGILNLIVFLINPAVARALCRVPWIKRFLNRIFPSNNQIHMVENGAAIDIMVARLDNQGAMNSSSNIPPSA
ncbi:uncharacterized protein VTP21DRAFT_6136 [Calcarisporiella thermophila]|uniref:uncharacterized protein n=1 Tax=Calcarisporiella thermophila TaxID=911321 RepID=UPI00374240EE